MVKKANFARNASKWKHEVGGDLILGNNVFAGGGMLGEDNQNGVNTFNTGGTHELNINGGIPQGVDNEGTPNLVEQGETKYKDYIFSNRLKVDNKHTFSDMAKKYSKESKERPNDPISKNGLEVKMEALKGIQELMKGDTQENIMGCGGKINKMDGLSGKSNLRKPTSLLFNLPLVATTHINKGLAIPSMAVPTKLPYSIPTNDYKEPTSEGLQLSDLRYAPAVGAGLATLTDTLGLTNKPDYTAAKQIGSMNIKPKVLGNYMGYTPFDKDYYTNQLLSSAAATRTGLRETSGGNRAAYQASLLGADYNVNKSIGQLARESEQENIQRKQTAMAYNQGIEQLNAQQAMQAQYYNNQYRQQGAMLAEQARSMANLAKMANLNNFLLSLGDIGSEETYRNMISSNKALKYDTSRSGKSTYKGNVERCGGKLKLK